MNEIFQSMSKVKYNIVEIDDNTREIICKFENN